MKTLVLNIQPLPNEDSLEVWMLIGDRQYQFTFSRKFDSFGKHKLQIITHDSNFGETFKFNQHIVGEVMNLVRRFYKGESVKLPTVVGDFGTSEQALALQKPFNKGVEIGA